MKFLCIFSFTLLYFSTGFEEKINLAQEIGAACQSEDIFEISSFEASAWPPIAGGTITLTIQGAFSMAESVSQIQHVFSNGNMRVYEGILINKNYAKGSRENYVSHLAIPQPSGTWTVNTFMYDSNYLNILACWEFTYNS